VLVAVVILFGIAGSMIAQRLPPPAFSLDYPEQSCFFNAQLAGLPPQASTPPDSVVYAQWFINNTGTCPWNEQVTFKHIRGNLDTPLEVVSVPSVQPGDQPVLSGQTFQPSIPITAPQQSGSIGVWRLYAPNNRRFGPEFTVTLEVVTGAPGPIPAASRPGVDWWFVIPALLASP
jgi:hypothetical protein